jgi:hypothetical protein
MENIEDKELQNGLDSFLGQTEQTNPEEVCSGSECKVKSKDGLIERVRINKQIIVEDGRQLLV